MTFGVVSVLAGGAYGGWSQTFPGVLGLPQVAERTDESGGTNR